MVSYCRGRKRSDNGRCRRMKTKWVGARGHWVAGPGQRAMMLCDMAFDLFKNVSSMEQRLLSSEFLLTWCVLYANMFARICVCKSVCTISDKAVYRVADLQLLIRRDVGWIFKPRWVRTMRECLCCFRIYCLITALSSLPMECAKIKCVCIGCEVLGSG